MSPASQLTLYLTFIGLGFTLPSPRIVRWCVTSDLEQNRCSNLGVTCNVPDVSVVCVLRSSAEDCKSAIRDGHADTMFLDSGAVYRTSLNATASKDTQKCLKDRQKALGAGRPILGAFIPECDEKGNYKPQQCHGSTGHCWCVKPNGEEIPGTKTPPGTPRVPCEDHNTPKCLKDRQKALGDRRPKIGAYLPDCDAKGDYKPQQCHGSTGHCWCVKPNGEEIPGTKTPPGTPPASCGDQNAPKCLKERQKALGDGKPILGAFIPDCYEKGDYKPQQCHGSTGYCWCVTPNGEEIPGTKTPPGTPPVSCEDHNAPKCLKERQKAGEGRPMLGAFVPDCDEIGDYKPQQCHGSTGHCWCVNHNGEEVPGTRTPHGTPPVPCQDHTPKCLRDRQKSLGDGRPILGAYLPDCDKKGNYKPQQCHGSTGYCWCVIPNGIEIPGTKTPPGTPPVPCRDHIPKCLKDRQKALGDGRPTLGAHLPDCDEKGNYKPQQCHGSTGYCWCVNPNGEELPFTKTPPGKPPVSCQNHSMPNCLKHRQKSVEDFLSGITGPFLPDCDGKGNYNPQQCHDSTGYCWCVKPDGEEIPGTKTPPGASKVSCEDYTVPKCLKDRQKALGDGRPRLGAYIPDCDEKGDYKPQQCQGSTGYCWCVKPNGEEIPDTKTPPGTPPVSCEDQNVPKCLKDRQKALGDGRPILGAFLPDCNEKGDYKPQQCHASTGYCWCVKPNGEEIPGTKTPPGTPRVSCEDQNASKCLKDRQKALGDGRPMLGAFLPDCNEKGDYKPQQCHASTGYCWCAKPNGEEIPGTKTPPGSPPVSCEDKNAQKCLKDRRKALGDGRPILGAFLPDCNEKGDYKPQQCHASTGYCWCAKPNGEEIPGTKTPPGTPPVSCEDKSMPKCLKDRQKAVGDGRPILGAFLPDCTEKGDYKPQQCHGSTGYCWCVKPNGEEIPGTKTPSGTPRVSCEDHNARKCLKDRQKALGDGRPMPGAFLPDCDEKGDYKPQQCHGSTGHCWCVKPNGEEIPGTKTPPGTPQVPCGDHNARKCLKDRQKALGDGRPMPGAYIPDCDEKGDYKPQQCHGSTGHCWCVKPNGEEIPGTKTPPGTPQVPCGDHNLTKCMKEHLKVRGDLTKFSPFAPECDKKGNYKPQQCHRGTGYCWCVNANGDEIPGTKTPPGTPPASCEDHVLGHTGTLETKEQSCQFLKEVGQRKQK